MGDFLRRNKNLRRPRKTGVARRRRQKLHRQRLLALGVPAEQVRTMDSARMRLLLKRPNKLANKRAKQP
ncbi:MAG: hypothetical protein NTV49_14650 [Kiritimatiellaeota bacterium]|nr:hypothetical protein [Kiritimatiellota bacterium]